VFSSDRVLTSEGVGANLVEVMADLTRATDRLAAAKEAELAWLQDHFGE
jgi:hypothetical protein